MVAAPVARTQRVREDYTTRIRIRVPSQDPSSQSPYCYHRTVQYSTPARCIGRVTHSSRDGA